MIAKLQPYPTYKPSGIDWLGDIPDVWEVRRVKYLISRNDGGVWGGADDSEGTPVLRSTEVSIDGRWRIDKFELAYRWLTANEISKGELAEGDLVVTKSSGSEEHIGKTALVDQKIAERGYCFSNFMQRMRPKKIINPKLLYFFLNSQSAREQYKYLSNSTTGLGNLNTGMLNSLYFLIIPKEEQNHIADFLDEKTKIIDELIAKKEKLVELLREKRAALITRAVTKGLNPNGKLKPSGVDWLGDIPKGWEVMPFKHGVWFQEGPGIMAIDFRENGVPLLRIENLKPTFVNLEGCNFLDKEKVLTIWRHFLLKKGDLLISASATTGIVSEVDLLSEGSIAYTGIIRFTPKRKIVIKNFIKFFVISKTYKSQIDVLQTGTAMQHYGPSHLRRVFGIFPPINEQKQIAGFLDAETAKIDKAVVLIESQIKKLKEYRSSLIYHAVTGKIKI